MCPGAATSTPASGRSTRAPARSAGTSTSPLLGAPHGCLKTASHIEVAQSRITRDVLGNRRPGVITSGKRTRHDLVTPDRLPPPRIARAQLETRFHRSPPTHPLERLQN